VVWRAAPLITPPEDTATFERQGLDMREEAADLGLLERQREKVSFFIMEKILRSKFHAKT
jgi:hypothetical protein